MVSREEHPTEQLLGLLEEDLQEEEAARVRAHVDACERCTQELAALRLLLAPTGEEGLSEIERARLHRDVLKEIDVSTAEIGPTWTRRLAPYLGTAAVLALLAVGVMTFDMTGGSDGDPPDGEALQQEGTGGGDAGISEEAAPFEAGDRRDLDRSSGEEEAGKPQAGAVGKSSLSSQPFPEPRPTFQTSAGEMIPEDLDELGRYTAPLTTFARSYRVDDVARLGNASLVELSKDLAAAEARTIRRCGRQILQTGGYSAIAAYGGYGSMDGREVLVLAFAWSPHPRGALDRFMVWAWPKGTCGRALEYRMGYIDP